MEMSVAHVPSVAGGTGAICPAPEIIRAWNRGGVTVIRITVEVTPVVVVPPPVTVRLTEREPGDVNANWTVRPLKGPAGLVEADGVHENVAPVSGSVAASVMARPASTSQLPLNWFWVAPVKL